VNETARRALRDRCRGISAGVFAADAGHLRDAAQDIASWGGAMLHFDVMDGTFVPAITGGPGFVKALDVGLVRDVHLMVEAPRRHVNAFADAGADIITIHAEADDAAGALDAVCAASARLGRPILAGLGLMPGTGLDGAEALLAHDPDLILFLAVDPRTRSGADIAGACAKVAALRARAGARRPILTFDGGVSGATIEEVARGRPDVVVSGSAIFGAAAPRDAFKHMVTACS